MGYLQRLSGCIFFLTAICSCSSSKNNTGDANEIIQADKQFCQYSVKEGFFKAFLRYADNNIVKLGDEQFPVIGKKEMAKVFGDRSGTKDLIWTPVEGEVAESGDLGYTWGNWHLTNKDTTYYGNYFTVWKKQPDGTWKVRLDGGNSTPPPINYLLFTIYYLLFIIYYFLTMSLVLA